MQTTLQSLNTQQHTHNTTSHTTIHTHNTASHTTIHTHKSTNLILNSAKILVN